MNNPNQNTTRFLTPFLGLLLAACGCRCPDLPPLVPPADDPPSAEQAPDCAPPEAPPTAEDASDTSQAPKTSLKKKKPLILAEMSKGTMDPVDVARVFNENIGALKDCYVPALEKDPELNGRSDVRFRIDAYGKVASVETTFDELGDEPARCIRDAVSGMVFPRPTDGYVTVFYALMFSPWVDWSKNTGDVVPDER